MFGVSLFRLFVFCVFVVMFAFLGCLFGYSFNGVCRCLCACCCFVCCCCLCDVVLFACLSVCVLVVLFDCFV